MTHLQIFALMLLLAGCATSDPLMTGKPADWKGKPAADLITAWGEPSKVIKSESGDEVWEYLNAGDFVAAEESNTSFNMFGMGGGASGGVRTVKQGERLSRYENLARFKVRKGKITKWYAARFVDGRIVWEDQ